MKISKRDFYGKEGGLDPVELIKPLPPPPLLPRPIKTVQLEILNFLKTDMNSAYSYNEIYDNIKGLIFKDPLLFIFNLAITQLVHTNKIDGKYIYEYGEWFYILKS